MPLLRDCQKVELVGAQSWEIRRNSAGGRGLDQMTSQDFFSPDDSGKTFLIVLTVLKCLFLMGNLSAGFKLKCEKYVYVHLCSHPFVRVFNTDRKKKKRKREST